MMNKRVLARAACCNGRQETLIALEWALLAVFAVDLLLKVYLREARIAYLTSFDGVARIASVLPIVQLRGQAPLGFLRVLRVYQLAKMVSCVCSTVVACALARSIPSFSACNLNLQLGGFSFAP